MLVGFFLGMLIGAFGLWNLLVGLGMLVVAVQLFKARNLVPLLPIIFLIYCGILCVAIGIGSVASPFIFLR